MTYYRIVRAGRAFQLEYRPRFWPFWFNASRGSNPGGHGWNSCDTIKEAEALAIEHAMLRRSGTLVKDLGAL